MYVPSFKCKYCGQLKEATIYGDASFLSPCECKESRESAERDYRIQMEQKRQKLRGTTR